MQRCFVNKVDDTFNPKEDLAIGPWCFDDINDLINIKFITPFNRDVSINFLSEHKKCFDMAHYLLNQDMQIFDMLDKKIFFLKNQVRYLFLTYFLYSRYCLVKNFTSIYNIDHICFEEVEKPRDLNGSNFLLILSSTTTGWIISNIIKILHPNHKQWFYSNYVNKQYAHVRSGEYKKFSIGEVVKNYLYKLKCVINNKCNIFKEVKGISSYVGILLSLIYMVRTIFKKSSNHVESTIFYEPPSSFALGFNFKEFEVIFNALKSYFVCSNQKEFKRLLNYKKFSVISNPSQIIYNHNFQLNSINFFVNGGKLFCLQHGACYATIVNHFIREAEYNFNAFITWGSRYKTYLNKHNFLLLPSPYLCMLSNSYVYQNQEKILWVTGIHFSIGDGLEYLYGTNVVKYMQNKLSFYKLLSKHIKQNLWYKTMPNDYQNICFNDLLCSEIPTDKVIKNGVAIDFMRQSKLVILDYYGTPFYEAMSMNVPILLCYLECVPFFDEVAANVFQEFKLLKVVHETPEGLSKFLHEIYYTDVYAWWNSEAIQKVRKKFLSLYANNDSYFIPWLKAILQGKI